MAAMISEIRTTKPKLGPRLDVKVAVWVRNPGPIAEVAIRNAAPSITLIFCLLFLLICIFPFLCG